MALKDIVDGLRTLVQHGEELLANDQQIAAPVDHLASAIADAGLGPVAGGLVVTLFNDIVARGAALEAESGSKAAAPPADPAPAAPEAPAADPVAPAGIPDAPVIGGTAG